MRHLLITLTLVLSVIATSFAGRKIPAVTVKSMDGKTFNTEGITNSGKPLIISFWATWCKPCVKELDAISELYDDWQKETGVKVVIISIDDSRTSTRAVQEVKTHGWTFDSYLDENSDFKRALNVMNCPHTFLLDANGEVVWQHTSYAEGDEAKLYELVQKVAKSEPIQEK